MVQEFRWYVQPFWHNTRVWQTDRQTELAWHIRAIAYMLSRVKTSANMRHRALLIMCFCTEMLGSCLAVAVLGVLYEGLKVLREYMDGSRCQCETYNLNGDCGNDAKPVSTEGGSESLSTQDSSKTVGLHTKQYVPFTCYSRRTVAFLRCLEKYYRLIHCTPRSDVVILS